MKKVHVIDSHTEGEPTRVVIDGFPDLGTGSAGRRIERFREDFDGFRSLVVREPRGSEAMVGALLLEPVNPRADAQVIFFNNVGYLKMCVHGTIGAAVTLMHQGRIGPGRVLLETVAGEVTVDCRDANTVSVENVPSYRHRSGVTCTTAAHGTVVGDVAWGGNWFYLIQDRDRGIEKEKIEELTRFTSDVMESLAREGITGRDGAKIDHVELFGPPTRADAQSKNFVLCPGKAYDRSPCGTGTSAKIACLAEDGVLSEGDTWIQESIIGSRFECTYRRENGLIIPSITGRAYVTADAQLLLDPKDPFPSGI